MTYTDIVSEMRDLGFPCAYYAFTEAQQLPYVLVVETHNSDLVADNYNYKGLTNLQVELYHNIKHPPSEKLIESRLKELRLPYGKTEVFIDSERLFQVVYEIQLIEQE